MISIKIYSPHIIVLLLLLLLSRRRLFVDIALFLKCKISITVVLARLGSTHLQSHLSGVSNSSRSSVATDQVEGWPGLHNTLYSYLYIHTHSLGGGGRLTPHIVVQNYNVYIQKAEQRNHKFNANLSYMVRLLFPLNSLRRSFFFFHSTQSSKKWALQKILLPSLTSLYISLRS